MGWMRTARIWVASCSLAAVSGVGIGVVFVSISNYEHRVTPAAGALPAPGEVAPARTTPPARSRVATSVGTSTAEVVAAPVARKPMVVIAKKPAKAQSHAEEAKAPRGERAKSAKPKPEKPKLEKDKGKSKK